MAFWEQHAYVDNATFLSDLAAFGAANGWTVATSTATQVIMSKAGVTFNISVASGYAFNMTATVDGITSPTTYFYVTSAIAGTQSYYRFVSCGDSLYIGRDIWYNSTTYYGWRWVGLIHIKDKIGAWNNGVLLNGMSSGTNPASYQNPYYFMNASTPTYGTLYYEGAWSTIGAAAEGRPRGSFDLESAVLSPNVYNAAVVPIPALVYAYAASTAYLKPLGFAEGLYRCDIGDLYESGVEMTVGGEAYVPYPEQVYLLFKVSS